MLAPPPAERVDQEAQPHRHPQRLRVRACAAVWCRPMRRAARDAQNDAGHNEAPLEMPLTSRRQRHSAVQQHQHPQELQMVATACVAASVRTSEEGASPMGDGDAPSPGPS
eukprot:1852079-Prymnesium_polylepis.1